MDPYAAQTQTYPPPPSSQILPQIQDPYLYNQQQYDPSQHQYDPSQQHYAYYTQIPQQQYDPSQQYPNPVYTEQPSQPQQQSEQENAPIHPPGVPVQNDPNQIAAYQQAYAQPQYQTDPNFYYAQYQQPQQQLSYPDAGMGHQVQPQWQPPPGQPGEYVPPPLHPSNVQGGPYGGSGSGRGGGRGGGSGRGGRRGSGSGRGGGRGSRSSGSSFRGRGGNGRVKSEPKPQFLAWCELCRVDCNTHEVLENHKNGKKHKKNLEIQEELQRLAAKTHESLMAHAIETPEVKVESQPVQFEEQEGNGLKRKMRDEERKSAAPEKKPKETVPFICELCDVKCESAAGFDSHLKGRRHIFNFQRFQEQEAQAAFGHAALQALYPALEAALYPALLQALAHNASTSYAHGGLDHQALLQLLQPLLRQTGPAFFPHGLAPAPAPGPPPLELQGQTLELVENQAAPVNEPESKTEDQVEPESKSGGQEEPESKTEDQVEPESKTDDQVEPESKSGDQGEPESKTKDEVDAGRPEAKTEEVDPEAVEPAQ